MRLEDFDTTSRITARVESNRSLTPGGSVDIHELELKLAQPTDIAIGQSVGVILEGPFDTPGDRLALGHHKHFRLYTVADLLDPDESDALPAGEETVTLRPDDSLETALRTFDEGGHSSLPVIDARDETRVIGHATQVAALSAYNKALVEISVEEHR